MENEKQESMNKDYSIIQQQGFIRNLTVTEVEGKDNRYKFQIRYIDEHDNLQQPEDWYSGFGKPPAIDGDYLIFTYKKNGIWNNVKDILDIKLTHEEADESDSEALEEMQNSVSEPLLDLDGEDVTINEEVLSESLSIPYRALLLNASVHLCIKRGTLTHEEVVAQFKRFLGVLE